jgi:hypothetical protein
MQSLNESFKAIGESPIKEERPGESKYPTSKMKRTEEELKTRILNISKNVNSGAAPSILKQLKEKSHDSTTS